MSLRQAKGHEIADKAKITRSGNLWLVPSQSGRGSYKVDPETGRCSCPDFEFTQSKCKHQYAVEITISRQRKTTTTTDARGTVKTTVTETVEVKRKTYAQPSWPAYHRAQTMEKAQFLYLLHKLCQGVGSPAQHGAGRRRLPLEDMVFAMAYKVYSTVSGRRFMSDLRDAHAKGYIANLPCYNTLFNYFESETLTPYLQMLIEESALPLSAIEEDFAVDSSGLSAGARLRWFDNKWQKVRLEYCGADGLINHRQWVKVHLMCGVKTNVVTAVEITDAYGADSPHFKSLFDRTAENFDVREVSADKAYLSLANLQTVARNASLPYIPFTATSKPVHRNDKTGLWRQMYHYFSYKQEEFMKRYHKRSNVESTFMMIKAKFGDGVRSKTKTAQINEALCKVLCHNICCLISAMYELGLKPKFYAEVA
jgi:hypothetical protein